MTAYREGTLALDQLTAFCVSEDRERQRQVLEQIGPHTPAYAIRRAMTEAKVRVDDRRVRFVGVEAYEAEGGGVLRDLEKACAKLGVRTRIEAVAVGVRAGIIDPEDPISIE
jgi:ParB family chromosome partitioning protein